MNHDNFGMTQKKMIPTSQWKWILLLCVDTTTLSWRILEKLEFSRVGGDALPALLKWPSNMRTMRYDIIRWRALEGIALYYSTLGKCPDAECNLIPTACGGKDVLRSVSVWFAAACKDRCLQMNCWTWISFGCWHPFILSWDNLQGSVSPALDRMDWLPGGIMGIYVPSTKLKIFCDTNNDNWWTDLPQLSWLCGIVPIGHNLVLRRMSLHTLWLWVLITVCKFIEMMCPRNRRLSICELRVQLAILAFLPNPVDWMWLLTK